MTGHDWFEASVFAAVILCGVSWLYWIREIVIEANPTVPEDQRAVWQGLADQEMNPIKRFRLGVKIRRLCEQHAKMFPTSKKRNYAAVSLLLFFLVPIFALAASLLITGKP